MLKEYNTWLRIKNQTLNATSQLLGLQNNHFNGQHSERDLAVHAKKEKTREKLLLLNIQFLFPVTFIENDDEQQMLDKLTDACFTSNL